MGKGDKKTKRGKINGGTFGARRPRVIKKEFPLKLKLALATRLRLNSINQSLLKASQLL